MPITLVFLPAKDIATFVGEGKVKLGITGEDMVAEAGVDVKLVRKLGFGKCTLSVQAPVASKITDVSTLAGKRVATSFPNLTKKFFAQYETTTETKIRFLSGSVEAACNLGIADAVVDLVETGTTMRAAGLEKVADVMSTQTVLIQNKSTQHDPIVNILLRRINGYFTAKEYKMVTYNVKESVLPAAIKITPGRRAPTITPLSEAGWMSVSAMVPNKETASVMDRLVDVGARDILLFDIANCRFDPS